MIYKSAYSHLPYELYFYWTKNTLSEFLVWPKACLEGVGNEITLPTKNCKDLATIYSWLHLGNRLTICLSEIS